MRTIPLFSLIVVAMLSACSSQESQFDKAQKSSKKSQNADATEVVDAKHSLKDKADAPKGSDGGDAGDDLGETEDSVDDVVDEVVTPTKDGGKDDDEDKGGGDGDDTPAQNPKDDEPEVVVELPKPKCIYNDPAAPNFVVLKDAFGPNLPPIDVPRAAIDGDLQNDNETFIGNFTAFLYPGNQWRLDWDGWAGRIPHDYTMVVVDAGDNGCTAYLKFVKQEPRTLNGCFDIATKVRMADGKDQVIALISKGDFIYNPATRRPAKVVEVVKGPEADKAMYEIAFAGRKVLVTETHPMPVMGALKQAKAVTTADYMYDEMGIIHRVEAVKALPLNAKQVVINLRLEAGQNGDADHMILANGIVAGDLFLQQRLAGPQTASR
jgi:hypothetical protein